MPQGRSPVDDQSGRRPRRRLGERHGTTLSCRWVASLFQACSGKNKKAPRDSGFNASQRAKGQNAGKVGEMSCGGGYGQHDVAGCTATRRLQRQDSTPTDETSLQARSVIHSSRCYAGSGRAAIKIPRYQFNSMALMADGGNARQLMNAISRAGPQIRIWPVAFRCP